ncbi:Uncharacterised protein [Vibrio cholerae]|nr:Uncharacterised protein [Vibrio cholerae]
MRKLSRPILRINLLNVLLMRKAIRSVLPRKYSRTKILVTTKSILSAQIAEMPNSALT